jgi:ParB/RepB/Spo0J family partition protein
LQGATLPVDTIRVGQRHRKDLGDIAGLAASMADLDMMLEPIVVRPDGRGHYQLVCGARRLAAAKQRGQTTVPAIVRNLTDAEALKAEFTENTHRKDFTLSEAVAIKRALEPIERAAAKERMLAGKPMEKFSEGNGRALDKVAAVVGKHRTTIAKAEAIVDAAKAEPEKFGKLLEAMDKKGRVNAPYKRLRVMKQAELIRAEPPPVPGRGPYRVGSVDFPWPYEADQDDPSNRAARPYPTMSMAQIIQFARERLRPLMHDDSVLALWYINLLVPRYVAPVLDAAGFSERTILTWVKPHFGQGDILRSQTEQCVIAVRGSPVINLTNESTVLFAPARDGHSAKPVEFYDLVERLFPAPRYCDLFSRYQHNDKWDCHGDEAPKPSPASSCGAPKVVS